MVCDAAVENQNTKKDSTSMEDFSLRARNWICMQITKAEKHKAF